ncbi:hypothetical protein HYE53_01495, partial [Aggregatibacter actinomycetemcomitans]|nr:hypothetical protein [Aggregatibacter actinomycetemcomitans]
SKNYWGETTGEFGWEKQRPAIDNFRKFIFDASLFTDKSNHKALEYFRIEMQRYFQFKEAIILSKNTK